MRQEISSLWTPFAKFVLSPALGVGVTMQVGMVLFDKVAFESEAEWIVWKVFFLLNWSVLMWLLYTRGMRLTKVAVSDDGLIVSNFFREIMVPFRDIETVKGSIFLSPDFIWVSFRRPTELGERIVFMPKRLQWPFSAKHMLVKRLEDLASGGTTQRSADYPGEDPVELSAVDDPIATEERYQDYHRTRGSLKPPLPKKE